MGEDNDYNEHFRIFFRTKGSEKHENQRKKNKKIYIEKILGKLGINKTEQQGEFG